MNAEAWATVGTIAVTVLLIVPGLFYAWYVVEYLIGDKNSYPSVTPHTNDRSSVRRGRR